MSSKSIDQLIINNPYEEPKEHWLYIRESQSFERKTGRRKSGYWRATSRNRGDSEDPGEFIEIPLVNKIRPRVKEWREKGYPNVTGVTKRLLNFWRDSSQRELQPFWCQFEAVETAIWLTEASAAEKQGVDIPEDSGDWERQCLKMATGTGKTVVMAMLIAWQSLNKIANPKDARFSKHILIIAPGLTVRDRLQVLLPDNPDNFYQSFVLVDSVMWQALLQAKIEVTNWHTLAPYNENYGPKVIKKGPESDEAFVRRVLPDFGNATNILIINDAIESGLVKTPKVAVRDDSKLDKDLKSRFFHIYEHVNEDLNRRAEKHEGLPDLVRNAVNILGADWLQSKDDWQKQDRRTPPVMIMISNRIETAARLEYSLVNGFFSVDELADKAKLIRIDQDALDKIEADEEEKLDKSKRELVEIEREKFNTVGKEGRAGEQVQCVIGVNMLSEGWDARTVTHILGLRAFTSQLLCEQVVGRGLRRISYDLNQETGLFDPEYVTVFGVPFTFLPAEGKEKTPGPEKPKTKIEPLQDRKELKIDWPHVLRVDYKLNYFLDLDWDKLDKLVLSPEDSPTVVEVAPTIEGRPKFDQISEINLDKLAEEHRIQKSKLQAAVRLHEQFGKNWKGDPGSHIGQLVQIMDKFLESDKLLMKIPVFAGSEKLKNIMIALNIQAIVNHIGNFIRSSSKDAPLAILDPVRPKRSTATAMTWYTSRKTQPVNKSQISHIVVDSGWEGSLAFELERNRIKDLISWVKNDHLGFEIFYLWQGQTHTYYPDYIIKFGNARHLLLEVKGQTKEQDKAKWQAAKEWVEALNVNGNFGKWEFKVLDNPKNVFDVVK
ncbi:MAG: hypothetical protein COT67_00915 [Candidatus Tagabacteria bacterium CG09_land_8_20_14_0_10_41_14]|uniref:Helicase/UvrB N-terminal domain-containing protein n=2 Tax=Candidatus Tagaibacteriota TaxID=1817918 RepID=A0A2H0WLT4_9BACT|nr:MAG: hypothetical protein COT67_00915 [Candidatus Tagabacteria bacterium CG09_land_8_20_14_0_10_41_14]PJE72892.1 MAG: hypothetical protein COV00_02895 [Candidatus Tagabacteria bacterium CG10_big_fil_rev_8_21_14_0_10_40_13]